MGLGKEVLQRTKKFGEFVITSVFTSAFFIDAGNAKLEYPEYPLPLSLDLGGLKYYDIPALSLRVDGKLCRVTEEATLRNVAEDQVQEVRVLRVVQPGKTSTLSKDQEVEFLGNSGAKVIFTTRSEQSIRASIGVNALKKQQIQRRKNSPRA